MKKKLIGLVLTAFVAVTPFVFSDAKANDSCTSHINYYFFTDIAEIKGYERNMVGKTIKHTSEYFKSTIPANAKQVSSGQVPLSRTGNAQSKSGWSLNNFWSAFRVGEYSNNVSYIGHGAWYKEGEQESNRFTGLGGFTSNQLSNASLLPKTTAKIFYGTVETNPSGLVGTVSRTYSKTDSNGLTPIQVNESNQSYVMPALYYIEYEVCEQVDEERYQVNQFFYDEEGKTIQEAKYGVFKDLENGARYFVDVPTSITVGDRKYTLIKVPDNANGTINNSDVDVKCYYKLRQENKYQVNMHYFDDSNNKIKNSDYGVKADLKKGDSFKVSCPTSLEYNNKKYTLYKSENTSSEYIVSDVDAMCYYKTDTASAPTPVDNKPVDKPPVTNISNPTVPNTVTSNPKTLDVPMIVIVAIGMLSFGTAIYYFVNSCKKMKQI